MTIFQNICSLMNVIRYIGAKWCYAILFYFLDYINGVAAIRRKLTAGDSTEPRTIEVFSIIDKLPFPEMLSGPNSYILRHESFERPLYLLKPDIYLSFLVNDMVYLVEMSPTANPYDTKRFPFFFLTHKELAKKLITIHFNEFIKLGNNIGDPKCDMTWMFHTGRCGSTALCQALNTVNDVVVISEAQHFTNYIAQKCVAAGHSVKALAENGEFVKLNAACINFLLKDFAVGQRVCLKTAVAFQYETVLPLIAQKYAHHKVMSVHRDGKDGSNSFYRSANPILHKLFRIMCWFSERTGLLKSMMTEILFILSSGMIFAEPKLLSGESDAYLLSYSMWVSNLSHFRVHAGNFKKLMTISNDDFQANKKAIVTKMFEFMGIGLENLEPALEALKADSQAGTILAKAALAGKDWVRDERVAEKCEQLVKKYDLPPFDQKFRFLQSSKIEIVS